MILIETLKISEKKTLTQQTSEENKMLSEQKNFNVNWMMEFKMKKKFNFLFKVRKKIFFFLNYNLLFSSLCKVLKDL